jgi:hypothetical protein
MELFHVDDENPGQIFWHPKGWAIYRVLEDYVRAKVNANGYVEVKTPSVMPQSLWERSGHWAKYQENMFVTESEKRVFALKPMNCPGHIEIFKQGLKSYRDLPLRMAEFGSCTRNEISGALHGIMRVRGFVQDDAHIFCTEAQIPQEVADFCAMLKAMYADFGFGDDRVVVKFSTRPEVRVGNDEQWDRAEKALAEACKFAGLSYEVGHADEMKPPTIDERRHRLGVDYIDAPSNQRKTFLREVDHLWRLGHPSVEPRLDQVALGRGDICRRRRYEGAHMTIDDRFAKRLTLRMVDCEPGRAARQYHCQRDRGRKSTPGDAHRIPGSADRGFDFGHQVRRKTLPREAFAYHPTQCLDAFHFGTKRRVLGNLPAER